MHRAGASVQFPAKMLAIGLGDAPAWLAAVGTVGALLVSLSLLRRAADDRRREQARLVSAWGTGTPQGDHNVLTYFVRNNSQEPVYNVILNVMCGVRGTFVHYLGPLGPGEKREIEILLPGYPRSEYPPSLSFVDSAGRSWLRDDRGRLARPKPEELEALGRENLGDIARPKLLHDKRLEMT